MQIYQAQHPGEVNLPDGLPPPHQEVWCLPHCSCMFSNLWVREEDLQGAASRTLLFFILFSFFFGLVTVCMLEMIRRSRLGVDSEPRRSLGIPGLFTTGNSPTLRQSLPLPGRARRAIITRCRSEKNLIIAVVGHPTDRIMSSGLKL